MHSVTDILLVEDEANIAEALAFILARAGWNLRHHADGAGANAVIREIRPRLVILDLMLPGRSGAEILMELRADPDPLLAATSVLMLTARGKAEDAAPGADRYLAKPFSNADLRDIVAQMLG